MLNSLLAFFIWKACNFSSFEGFLYWKSRNYSQIYLSRIINYCYSVLTLYITWGAFSLVCFLSVFFSFFLSSSFLFLSVFFLTDNSDSYDSRNRRENHSSRFLPLSFTRSICNYQSDSWWDLFYLDIFVLFAFL